MTDADTDRIWQNIERIWQEYDEEMAVNRWRTRVTQVSRTIGSIWARIRGTFQRAISH